MAHRIVVRSAIAVALGTLLVTGACARRESASPAREGTAGAPPTSDPNADRDAAVAEESVFEVSLVSGPYTLRGFVSKPAGEGPFPVIVYNHGSERDPDAAWLADIAAWLRSKGYAAFFPFRRGAGGSQGPYWQDVVNARPRDETNEATLEQIEAQSDDVLAAIDWIAAKTYSDKKHIAVSGCSFGGIETVLAAERSPSIYAAVDFAGGSMSWSTSPALQDRMRDAVRNARVPIFFLQAKNDFNTAPSLDLAAQMTAAGKPHALKIFPAYGDTHESGHAGFCMHGFGTWGDDVLRFLREPSSTRFSGENAAR